MACGKVSSACCAVVYSLMYGWSRSQWLLPLGTSAAVRIRLFCFPPAGGGTVAFRAWAPLAAPGVEISAVLLPGREARSAEALIHDIEELAYQVAGAIVPFATEPFALFGHSLGALLAYEVARKLDSDGCPPKHLFVSGHQAPAVPSRRAPIAHLPDAAFIQGLIDLGGTPPEILQAPDLLALLTPMLRADFALAEHYVAPSGPRLPFPVTALGGTEDPWVDAAGLDGWRDVTAATFARVMLPGGHFYLTQARSMLVEHVNASLLRALAVA